MGRLITALRRRFKGQQVAAAFGVFEEIYVPNRYEAMQEFERQAEVPAPAPAPGDPNLSDTPARADQKTSGEGVEA